MFKYILNLFAMNKKEEKEKAEELISITNEKKTSIFNNPVVLPVNNDDDGYKEEEIVIEEKTNTKSTITEVIEETLKPHDSCYYITTFIKNEEEITVYTKEQPLIESNLITLHEPFERFTFTEIVLKKKKIESYCFKELEENEIVVNMDEGVLIKTIQEQKWFSRSFEETKKSHDERVLACYRALMNSESPIQGNTVKQVPSTVKSKNVDNGQWETITPNMPPKKVIKNKGEGNITPVKDRLPGLEKAFENL